MCFLLRALLSSYVVLELIRAAVGSAQILMSQKVQQFFRMCQQSVVSSRLFLSHPGLIPLTREPLMNVVTTLLLFSYHET